MVCRLRAAFSTSSFRTSALPALRTLGFQQRRVSDEVGYRFFIHEPRCEVSRLGGFQLKFEANRQGRTFGKHVVHPLGRVTGKTKKLPTGSGRVRNPPRRLRAPASSSHRAACRKINRPCAAPRVKWAPIHFGFRCRWISPRFRAFGWRGLPFPIESFQQSYRGSCNREP